MKTINDRAKNNLNMFLNQPFYHETNPWLDDDAWDI